MTRSFLTVAKESASSPEADNSDELEQITVARALINYRSKEKIALGNSPGGSIPFPKKFTAQNTRPTSPQPQPPSTSKILPLICPKTMVPRSRPSSPAKDNVVPPRYSPSLECHGNRPQKFPAAGASPYAPISQFRASCRGMAPPVTIRNAMPVFSAPPRPPPARIGTSVMQAPPVRIAPPVSVRQAVPVFAAPPARKEDVHPVQKEEPSAFVPSTPPNQSAPEVGAKNPEKSTLQEESAVVQSIDKLKI